MKTAFIVLGAQRSGTSVTSHMMSEFGIYFGEPNHFLQDNHNPLFFELRWVNALNDEIVKQMGRLYTDFFLPVEEDYENAGVDAIARDIQHQMQQEFGDCHLIGLKDPRFSLTFPVWERVLHHLGYWIQVVLVFRSPASFLRSNQKLFHNWESWTDERHLNFWLQFNMAAVYFTRRYSVHLISYDSLMSEPVHEAQRFATTFGYDPALVKTAACVVNSSLQHHKSFAETGNFLCDRYYQQLLNGIFSSGEYLLFRENLQRQSTPFLPLSEPSVNPTQIA